MGVKGLWEVVSPTGELVCLAAFAGQAVAVDLASWLVDSQSLQLGHAMTHPHLRNLFFRTAACLQAGVLPVMVLEGDAPSLKWNTISSRNQRNFGRIGGRNGGVPSTTRTTNTGKRTHFNAVLKKCTELFDLLGVPWVRAAGEAEATCAALNYHQVVDGVITQDSDVFLYGGNTVFRNFTASQKKVTAEKYSMDIIEKRLQVTRGGMILLAIMLGCDYLPGGVHGIGKDTALRLLRAVYSAGDQDPTQRLQLWAAEHIPTPTHSELASTKWKKGNDDVLEEGVKKRLAATEGFPFTELLAEFQLRLPQPLKKVKWTQPDFEKLVHWCGRMLEWEASYAMQKVAPVVTRWTVTHGTVPRPLQPVSVVKRCVKQGVVCLRLQWRVSISSSMPPDSPEHLTTEEPLEMLRFSLPHLVQQFEDFTLASKKGKKKTKTRKATGTPQNKENIHESKHTITEYFKPVTSGSAPVTKTTPKKVSSRISDDKITDTRKGELEVKIACDHKSTEKHSSKDLHLYKEHQYGGEEEEDEEDLECDERELSVIIDRIINMKMNVGNQQHNIRQHEKQRKVGNKCESGKRSPVVQDLNCTNTCQLNKMGKKTQNSCIENVSEENVPSPQQSLFDRASKRLYKKDSKHLEPSLTYAGTEIGLCLTGNSNSTFYRSTIGAGIESNSEVKNFYKTHTLWSSEVELKAKSQCHNVSKDIFEDTFTEDIKEVMFEDALTEDTLAVMFEETLALNSSLSDSNISQVLQDTEMTGCSPNFLPRCLSPQDYALNLSPVLPDSPVHESSLSHPPQLGNNSVNVENDDSKRIFPEENTNMKLPADSMDFKIIHTEKQNKYFLSVVSSPMVKDSVKEESGAWFSEAPTCDEDTITPLTSESQFSTDEHSSCEETGKDTTALTDDLSHCEDVLHHSTSNHETSVAAPNCNKAAIIEDIVAEAPYVSSLKRSTETNPCESKENYNIQFNSNNRKERSKSGKENLSVRHTSESHLEPHSGPDDQVWTCDPFSPVEVTLTLAQRLKLKCSDKRFRKLLDDLG